MPARKPHGLSSGAATKEAKAKRKRGEDSVTATTDLPKMPAVLKSNNAAASVWRRVIKDYNSLEAKIVTRLDYDLLIDYCVMIAEIMELRKTREQVSSRLDEAKTLEEVLAAGGLLIKIDSRADRKRAQLHVLRQSLYMTPRARAGFVPPEKKQEEPEDELERLLNEVDLRGG